MNVFKIMSHMITIWDVCDQHQILNKFKDEEKINLTNKILERKPKKNKKKIRQT